MRATVGLIGFLVLVGCGGPSDGAKGPQGTDNSGTRPGVTSTVAWGAPSGFTSRTLVEAGEVRQVSRPGLPLQGTFTIRTARGNEQGIELGVSTVVSGGACLMARVEGVGGRCRSDADCNRHFTDLPGSGPGRQAYCLDEAGKNHPSAGTCWIKPDNSYCEKDKGLGTHKTPSINPLPVRDFAKAKGGGEVRWMALGCLNGPDVKVPDEVPQDVRDRLKLGEMAKPCMLRGYPVPAGSVMYDTGPSYPSRSRLPRPQI
jgi:hypothetical protein